MISSRVLRPVLLSAAACVTDATKDSAGDDCICKPSQLPIYTKEVECKPKEVCALPEPGPFELVIGTVRRGVFTTAAKIKRVAEISQHYLETGLSHADGVINYLQQEENVAPKYGAVGVGGLTGFIFGLRGGFIKKFVYTSAGALGMAAVCYPTEASEYSKLGLGYAMIAYNFIAGAKKDDPPLELPKIPTSLNQAWDTIKSFGQSASVSDNRKEQLLESNSKKKV